MKISFEPARRVTTTWICPGMHLANGCGRIAISTILATLQISKAVGDDGNEIVPEVSYRCIIPIGLGLNGSNHVFHHDPEHQLSLGFALVVPVSLHATPLYAFVMYWTGLIF